MIGRLGSGYNSFALLGVPIAFALGGVLTGMAAFGGMLCPANGLKRLAMVAEFGAPLGDARRIGDYAAFRRSFASGEFRGSDRYISFELDGHPHIARVVGVSTRSGNDRQMLEAELLLTTPDSTSSAPQYFRVPYVMDVNQISTARRSSSAEAAFGVYDTQRSAATGGSDPIPALERQAAGFPPASGAADSSWMAFGARPRNGAISARRCAEIIGQVRAALPGAHASVNKDLGIHLTSSAAGLGIQAHGIHSKSPTADWKRLIEVLDTGINQNRPFSSGRLVDRMTRDRLGTAAIDHTVPIEGSFVLVTPQEAPFPANNPKIVLVNDAFYHAIPDLRAAYPNVRFVRADRVVSELPAALAQVKSRVPEVSPASPASPVEAPPRPVGPPPEVVKPKAPSDPSPIHHFGANADLQVSLMRKHGLRFGRRVDMAGVVYRLSDPFSIGKGRTAVLALVETGGQQYFRVYYRSRSQNGYRVLPAYDTARKSFDKGDGEDALALPGKVNEFLLGLATNGKISEEDGMDLVLAGVPNYAHLENRKPLKEKPDWIAKHLDRPLRVTAEVSDAELIPSSSGSKRYPPPEEVRIRRPELAPVLSAPVRVYKVDSSVAGELEALVYPSKDGKLEYTFLKDSSGHVWIGSVERIDAGINVHGVRRSAVDAPGLLLPRWEYAEHTPLGHMGGENRDQPDYRDVWSYLKKVPVIQEWYRVNRVGIP